MPVRIVEPGSSLRLGEGVHIGLINNMPDGALKATERQFLALLEAASNDVAVCLSFYALPDVPRTEAARLYVSQFYSGIENLWESRLDGLIVTGTEPRTPALIDEPYWRDFAKILDWAEDNTHSAIWSCLAAHAAVLHIDGIARRRLATKRFGVFECARASEDHFTACLPPTFQVPHSRWNDIPGDELVDCGYRVLSRSMDGGVDSFVKQRKSLFVCFQGHPEYEASTLLFEYRRDIGSYLRGERNTYPSMPQGCFDRDSTNALIALQNRALTDRREGLLANRGEGLLADFPATQLEKRLANTWTSMAAQVYGNWLAYLCAQRERRIREKQRWNQLARRKAV